MRLRNRRKLVKSYPKDGQKMDRSWSKAGQKWDNFEVFGEIFYAGRWVGRVFVVKLLMNFTGAKTLAAPALQQLFYLPLEFLLALFAP